MTVNRRYFLQKTTAAMAILCANPVLSMATEPAIEQKKRRFTMHLHPFMIGVNRDISQKQLIVMAYWGGFESVLALPRQLALLSDGQMQDLQAEMKAKKLVWGLGSLGVEFRKDEQTFRKALAELPELAGALQKAGVTRTSTYIMSNHAELNYLQNFRQHAIRLREIAAVLKDYNIRLGLEYVGPKSIWAANKYPFIKSMAETKELIAAIGQPNVGFHLDTAHWFTSGEGIADILTLTNKDVVGCDLNDALPGIGWENQPGYERTLPMATGVIDTKSFLNALVAICFDGPVQAEPFNKELNALEDELAIEKTAAAMKKAFALVK